MLKYLPLIEPEPRINDHLIKHVIYYYYYTQVCSSLLYILFTFRNTEGLWRELSETLPIHYI